MKFRVPLSVLGQSLDAMADFPYREPGSVTYEGPTLFVRGTRSRYVTDDSVPAIKRFFPNYQMEDVEAGHWLISENPEAFRQGEYDLFGALLFKLIERSCCQVFERIEPDTPCSLYVVNMDRIQIINVRISNSYTKNKAKK